MRSYRAQFVISHNEKDVLIRRIKTSIFFHPQIHDGSNFFRPVETVLTRGLTTDGEKKGGVEEQAKKQPDGL